MFIDTQSALESFERFNRTNMSDGSFESLYLPRDYTMQSEGKRMRALLCMIGYGLYREDFEASIPLAFALELFHNFTLVHDDIMDEARLRRGKPSVYHKFGQNQAILSGDVMLIEVYDRLLKLDSAPVVSIAQKFSRMAREVCEGQSLDMDFESRDDVTIEEYLKMIELKTAVLLGRALELGAELAGADTNDLNHLYHFAVNAGIGFQIQDDFLDIYGDPKLFGKKWGGDIVQGKKTYLYLRTLQLLPVESRPSFQSLYAATEMPHDEKIQRVKEIFDEVHIDVYCQEAKQAFYQLAKSHLSKISINSEDKTALESFTTALIDRIR